MTPDHPADVVIDLPAARTLLIMFGGEDARITLRHLPDGHCGPGVYAHYTDLPEEGSVFLSEASPSLETANTLRLPVEVSSPPGPPDSPRAA